MSEFNDFPVYENPDEKESEATPDEPNERADSDAGAFADAGTDAGTNAGADTDTGEQSRSEAPQGGFQGQNTGSTDWQPPYGGPGANYRGGYSRPGYGYTQQQGNPPPYYYGTGQQPYHSQPYSQFGEITPAPETKGRKKGLRIFYTILAILVIAAGLVAAGMIVPDMLKKDEAAPETTATTSGGPSLSISESPAAAAPNKTGALSPVDVASKVKPSVVGILVYASSGNFNTGTQENLAGEGSGIIMGQDSSKEYTYIITCAHVISDAKDNVMVQVENGTQYEAEVVGYDLRTDVGVIKVKATRLKAAEFGNSDALKVGEDVFAVGNPGGTEFFGSFTGGMVSAIDRPVNSQIGYTMQCIQHDAAINPGNSGGALVNTSGQVIGINSLKIIDTNYEGMGFAIPISSAKKIVDSLIKYGYVPNRPKLGITYIQATSSRAYSMIIQANNLPIGSLYIEQINSDSSLSKTQARKGDLIIAVDGKDLHSADVLLEKIDKGKVGDTLTLTLCRVNADYKITTFKVKAVLVEDKGNFTAEEPVETTTELFDFFN